MLPSIATSFNPSKVGIYTSDKHPASFLGIVALFLDVAIC